MRSLVVLVAFASLLPACKKTPEQAQADAQARVQQLCDGMNDFSLAYVAGIVGLDVESLDTPGVRDQLKASCKALPLDLVECANQLAFDDPKCDEALGKHLGMTDTTPEGSGPAPSWVLASPFEIYDISVSPSGQVAIAGDKGLAVVVDGAVKWSVELEDGNGRVGWWKDCTLTGVGGELRCYDAAGAVAWSTRVATEDGDWLSAIAPGPEGLVTVVTTAGAISRIDGDRCATAAEGCSTPLATVEALGGASIEVLPSGAMLGSNDSGATLVSATGTVLAEKPAEYAASMPRGGLVVVKSEVLRANPSCQAKADDCFSVVATEKDMELVVPVEIEGVGLAYADSYGVISMTGTSSWKIDAGNDGDLFSDGTTLYSVGHQLGLGDALDAPPQLRAIDARTGRTRWITTLGTERAGLLSAYVIALQGKSLIVATKKQLFSVPLAAG